MRYIGGKSRLADWIVDSISSKFGNIGSAIDVFAGSGAMSSRFKTEGWSVACNDIMYFSYAFNRGTVALNAVPDFSALPGDPFSILNSIDVPGERGRGDCFIYQNYAPHDGCERMYFKPENALRIDAVRQQIETWHQHGDIDDDGYFYLLASLIDAVPSISNITGVYGAYLKFWEARTHKALTLKPQPVIGEGGIVRAFNEEGTRLLGHVSADLLYADPPYNSRQYLPNYHVLETIARYDSPVLHGTTGMREYSEQKSEFCMKGKVADAFRSLIDAADVRYVAISYNSEGLLPTEQLADICRERAKDGTFELIEKPYRRYKSHNETAAKHIMEQLYVFEKLR